MFSNILTASEAIKNHEKHKLQQYQEEYDEILNDLVGPCGIIADLIYELSNENKKCAISKGYHEFCRDCRCKSVIETVKNTKHDNWKSITKLSPFHYCYEELNKKGYILEQKIKLDFCDKFCDKFCNDNNHILYYLILSFK
jgi:hypothetical protein